MIISSRQAKPAAHTLAMAVRLESADQQKRFVVRNGDMFVVETRMPMMGGIEWYTSDGVRHG